MDDRIAIISDVHGNTMALDAVLADIDSLGIKTVFHLGDIVGYGDDGAECLRVMQKRGIQSVQGNHDGNIRPPRDPEMRPEAQVALEREFNQMDEAAVNALLALPERLIVEDTLIFVHGSLTGRDEYILNNTAVRENNELMATTFSGLHICFFGHTHLPMFIRGRLVDMEFRIPRTVRLAPRQAYLINPGSVGQPRDRNPQACYGVYDHAKQEFSIRRIPYDIEAQQERMRRAGLPDKLWMRLALGV